MMDDSRKTLDDWLAAGRAELARAVPPGWVETALAARHEELMLLRRLRPGPAQPPNPLASRWWFFAIGLPAGAALLVAVAIAILLLRAGPDAAPRAGAFVALTSLETIAAEARPVVIASEVPRSQLASFGVPVDPARADLPVRAEFLVSRRGAVLAVRFSPE